MKRTEQERKDNILVQIYQIDLKIQKLEEAKARLEKVLLRSPKVSKPQKSKEELLEEAKLLYSYTDSSRQVSEMNLG